MEQVVDKSTVEHASKRRAGCHLRRDFTMQSRPIALYNVVAVAVVLLGVIALRSTDGSPAIASADSVAAVVVHADPVGAHSPDVRRAPPSPQATTFESGWVAVLASVDRRDGQDALEAALAPMRGVVPSARILASDSYGSLPPGQWVIVDGPFSTGNEAAEYCVAIGSFIGGDCQGRVLSTNSADRNRWCIYDRERLSGSCD
jgi:hypothetical protein